MSPTQAPIRLVPARHKREIIVVRGKEDTQRKLRTSGELIEQLNNIGVEGQAVAVRRLPSGDALLTMESESVRDRWLQDKHWLEAFGEGALIKRREFTLLVHGIKVSQVQS